MFSVDAAYIVFILENAGKCGIITCYIIDICKGGLSVVVDFGDLSRSGAGCGGVSAHFQLRASLRTAEHIQYVDRGGGAHAF